MRLLTDKQNPGSGNRPRNANFQASRRLEGATVPLVTLTAEARWRVFAELRRRHER